MTAVATQIRAAWWTAYPKLQRDKPVRKVFLKLGWYTSESQGSSESSGVCTTSAGQNASVLESIVNIRGERAIWYWPLGPRLTHSFWASHCCLHDSKGNLSSATSMVANTPSHLSIWLWVDSLYPCLVNIAELTSYYSNCWDVNNHPFTWDFCYPARHIVGPGVCPSRLLVISSFINH